MKKLVDLSFEEGKKHEEKWGKFNSVPPNFQEISYEEWINSDFFLYCIEGIEFRQIFNSNIDPDKLINGPLKFCASIKLFYTNSDWNIAILVEYEHALPAKARYFKFTDCIHEYTVTKSGHCYTEYKCKKCGRMNFIDSSG